MAYIDLSKQNLQYGEVHHHKYLKRNKFIIDMILFCLTLERPFHRFTLANKSICILIARARFLLFAWLTIKFSVSILFLDCQYSQVRALMWDWTIYYPVSLRPNLVRCFLSMYAYHLCTKSSSFVNVSKKPFDASLLDFLKRPPPPPLTSGSNSLFSTPLDGCNYLRDRRHWFELSEKLRNSFKRVLWWVLPVCSCIVLASSVRLGYLLEIERDCDIRMPLLRFVGLLELNFCLIECIFTFVGAFVYSLMVRHDLLLQANRVELYLIELASKYKAPTSENLAMEDMDDYLLFEALGVAATGGGWQSFLSYQQLPDISKWLSSSGLSLQRSPVALKDYERAHYNQQQKQLNHSAYYWQSRDGGPLIESIRRKQSRYSLTRKRLDADKRAPGDLEEALREAQTRVTLFLKCIDSHKPAVSYLGGTLLIWLITSLSWVPVLLGNSNDEHGTSRRSNVIYLTSCALAVSASLVFTAICAAVYHRSIDLATSIFRLCAKHHGQTDSERWNKILLIWFSPNRCAFKIGNFFQLTYLNILKSFSFLVSGLTFIINYMRD